MRHTLNDNTTNRHLIVLKEVDSPKLTQLRERVNKLVLGKCNATESFKKNIATVWDDTSKVKWPIG